MKLRGGARIGVDIGGTFTDLVLSDAQGRTWFDKRASTPGQPEQAVLDGILSLLGHADLEPADLVEVLHGTTVGSNALLQQSGARTGLITTKGFRDVLEIGRVRTPDMFDLQWDKPVPLVPRRLRGEVAERVAADGGVILPLDEDGLLATAADLVTQGVESIAICFINSYRNPAHERRADALLREAFPDLAITASVSVLAEMREYERTSTAVVNAYVLPILQSYLQRLCDGLLAIGVEHRCWSVIPTAVWLLPERRWRNRFSLSRPVAPPVSSARRGWGGQRRKWTWWCSIWAVPRRRLRWFRAVRFPALMNTSSAPVFRSRPASSRPAAI